LKSSHSIYFCFAGPIQTPDPKPWTLLLSKPFTYLCRLIQREQDVDEEDCHGHFLLSRGGQIGQGNSGPDRGFGGSHRRRSSAKHGVFPAEIQKVRDRGAGEVRLEQLPIIRFLYRFPDGGRVRLSTLENFTRELATLLGAGIPLLRSLQILHRNVVSTNLKSVLAEISENIENGASFSDALARHPQVFDRLFLNMVKVGEVGGVLEESLDRLAACYEKSADIRAKVLSALYYPVTVSFIAITLVTLILTFIVPRLQEIYEGMGSEFPAMTLLLIRASEAVRFKAPWLIGGMVAALVLILQVRRTRTGRRLTDAIQLKVPLFGILFQKAAVARFARTLATLLHAGVPILQALAIVKDSSGNELIASAMIEVHASIREGGNMAEALKNHPVFPDLMVHHDRGGRRIRVHRRHARQGRRFL
jgi:type IV pilus assembly protein PilC